jgi:hypothetical protein
MDITRLESICAIPSFVLLITDSNNSLFAVPANQEFVYIQPRLTEPSGDHVGYYLEQLRTSCAIHKPGWHSATLLSSSLANS